MGFSSKRGRPKQVRPIKDLGTKELQKKREQNVTIEPLDLFLQKSLITENQHWAGMHLRWLFTIKMGAPNISASRVDLFEGRDLRQREEAWQVQRQAEYDTAVKVLHNCRAFSAVLNLAVYGTQKMPISPDNLQKIREGLSALCKFWRQKA